MRPLRTRFYLAAGLGAILVLARTGVPLRGQGEPPLPDRLNSYIKNDVKLTSEEQKQLLAGQPVTQLLEPTPRRRWLSSAPCGLTRRLPATSPP